MGIKTEYNPDLALRNNIEFVKGNKKKYECIPESLKKGQVHKFLKKGQRVFWIEGEIPLLETKGNQQLSKPIASIKILEATHFILNGKTWTKGKYNIVEVFDMNEEKIHFDGFTKIA